VVNYTLNYDVIYIFRQTRFLHFTRCNIRILPRQIICLSHQKYSHAQQCDY